MSHLKPGPQAETENKKIGFFHMKFVWGCVSVCYLCSALKVVACQGLSDCFTPVGSRNASPWPSKLGIMGVPLWTAHVHQLWQDGPYLFASPAVVGWVPPVVCRGWAARLAWVRCSGLQQWPIGAGCAAHSAGYGWVHGSWCLHWS